MQLHRVTDRVGEEEVNSETEQLTRAEATDVHS
jgi:hypothetical protein